MTKLYLISKNKKTAPDKKLGDTCVRGRRFYTNTDMSIIKHDQAVHNSQIKRGEIDKKGSYSIYPCGCGHEGCFIHIERE